MAYLARAFSEKGLKVDIVLSTCEGPYVDDLPDSVRIVDLRASRVISSLLPLVRYLREKKPTILLSAMEHANLVALWARHIAGSQTRVVLTEHNMVSVNCRNAGLRGRLMPMLMRRFYGWADHVIAVSRGVGADLAQITRLAESDVSVVHNPVVVPEIFEQAGAEIDHPWFDPVGPPVIVSVGRLTAQKGYATLLRAVALVKERVSIRLLILGEGEERPVLERLADELGIADCVCFQGHVNNPFAYVSRARLFVLSSAWEGFGVVLVEAMAVGAPVVSTDCPSGPAEILEDGRFGRLCPVNDPIALARAIEMTLRETPDRVALTKRAMDFSYDAVADRYLQILYLQAK